MSSEFHIQNYAVIGSLSLEFRPGLNILWGETGSAKSILKGPGLLRPDSWTILTAGNSPGKGPEAPARFTWTCNVPLVEASRGNEPRLDTPDQMQRRIGNDKRPYRKLALPSLSACGNDRFLHTPQWENLSACGRPT